MAGYEHLPQVERVLSDPRLASWIGLLSRPLVKRLVGETLDGLRAKAARGEPASAAAVMDALEAACRAAARGRLGRVINATGVMLHTNLGRAPVAREAWEAAAAANVAYSNLEMDTGSGKRGGRGGLTAELAALLVGAEDALVVNNNAAAVLLTLSALAKDREVVVSRGEQVQIGGGFRIPDILALSGARLVEVGTTNITTAADYAAAIRPETAMVLRVHSSNFRIRGFTASPSIGELARALPERVVLAVDQGSGTTSEELPGEMRAGRCLAEGAQLVCFSGDKVLGGPQAGIVAGRRELVRQLAVHPLMRAFRPGKAVYALLQEVLVRRLNGTLPGHVERLFATPPEAWRAQGEELVAGLDPGRVSVVASEAVAGGGSAPDESFHSFSVELDPGGKPEELLERLRDNDPPIIATVRRGRVGLNLATLLPDDLPCVRAALLRLVGGRETA